MKPFAALLCVLFIAGCSSVTMKEPFTESQLTEKEQARLTGSWRLDGQVVHVAFTSNGTPWLAMVDWKNNDFHLQKYRLHFTKRNDALYVSMPQEPGAANRFIFAELKPGGSTIVAWMPNLEVFEKLIDQGTLKGTVKKEKHSKEILLDTPSAAILELISTNSAAINYKNPLVFQRLE